MNRKTLGSKVNAVKRAYSDNTKRPDTLNYLKPPEKGLPALFFPMQLQCDFVFKCLLILYNPNGENIAAPEIGWKMFFFQTQQERTPLGIPRKHQDA